MSQPPYTSIPDTADRAYWQLKADDAAEGLQRFVPLNPQLHRQLKAQAWPALQARKAKRFKEVSFPDTQADQD